MALILRYVDIRGVGFVLVCWLAASRRLAVVAGGGSLSGKKEMEGKEKRKRKRKRKENKNKVGFLGFRQVELGLA